MAVGCDHGIDEMTLETVTYGFARYFLFMVNNVSGFIGPETIYDGKQIIQTLPEDHFMGKLHGLKMGMPPIAPTTPTRIRMIRKSLQCC